MLFLLKKQMDEVREAQVEHQAAKALDKHRSLQAKARAKRLLSSKKGLATAFAAGMIKGTTSSREKSQSNFSSLVVKQLIAAWLGSTSVSGAETTGSDLAH